MAAMPRVSTPNKLPENVALDSDQQKEFTQKVAQLKLKQADDDGPGVLYVGHIPRGFFEPQMKEYFSQFGKVSRIRLARSKKTGNSKGYAFVQFASRAVAKIVSETMNNYLMFHRLLKCQLLPMEKVHPEMFKGAERRFKKPKAHLISIERHNKLKSEEKTKQALSRMKRKKAKSLSKLADIGIDFEYPGVVKVVGKESPAQGKPSVAEKATLETQEALAQEALDVLFHRDSDSDEAETPMTSLASKKSDIAAPTAPSSGKKQKKMAKAAQEAKLLAVRQELLGKKAIEKVGKSKGKVVKQPKPKTIQKTTNKKGKTKRAGKAK